MSDILLDQPEMLESIYILSYINTLRKFFYLISLKVPLNFFCLHERSLMTSNIRVGKGGPRQPKYLNERYRVGQGR